MRRESFTDARFLYRYDPSSRGVHKKLFCMEGDGDHLRTVNAYCSWLRQLRVTYEVRQHRMGYFLVKSEGLNERVQELRSKKKRK